MVLFLLFFRFCQQYILLARQIEDEATNTVKVNKNMLFITYFFT